MTVILHDKKLAYFSVPKCGSTSLKHSFFEYENGRRFERFRANGKMCHIHNAVYPFRPVTDYDLSEFVDWHRLAILRDPVSRLASAFANRVVRHGDLNSVDIPPEMAARGVVARPDFDRFVAHLEDYRALSWVVAHHCEPLSVWLGRDPGVFTRLYALRELNQFIDDVSQILGGMAELDHLKKSKSGGVVRKTAPETEARILAFYREDVALFGDYF